VQRNRFAGSRISENIQAQSMYFDTITRHWSFIKGEHKSFSDSSYKLAIFDTLIDSTLSASPNQMVVRIKSVDQMSYWELKHVMELAQKRGEKISRYQADLNFKIALPFMNFIVMLLGFAIIARAGKKGSTIAFGIGLILVFSYWVLSQFILSLGKNETLNPMVSAWACNIFFLIIGLFLYRRASQ
jgi:lipopolysaccharide export system permease protein